MAKEGRLPQLREEQKFQTSTPLVRNPRHMSDEHTRAVRHIYTEQLRTLVATRPPTEQERDKLEQFKFLIVPMPEKTDPHPPLVVAVSDHFRDAHGVTNLHATLKKNALPPMVMAVRPEKPFIPETFYASLPVHLARTQRFTRSLVTAISDDARAVMLPAMDLAKADAHVKKETGHGLFESRSGRALDILQDASVGVGRTKPDSPLTASVWEANKGYASLGVPAVIVFVKQTER